VNAHAFEAAAVAVTDQHAHRRPRRRRFGRRGCEVGRQRHQIGVQENGSPQDDVEPGGPDPFGQRIERRTFRSAEGERLPTTLHRRLLVLPRLHPKSRQPRIFGNQEHHLDVVPELAQILAGPGRGAEQRVVGLSGVVLLHRREPLLEQGRLPAARLLCRTGTPWQRCGERDHHEAHGFYACRPAGCGAHRHRHMIRGAPHFAHASAGLGAWTRGAAHGERTS
jgi:hypothetical protein